MAAMDSAAAILLAVDFQGLILDANLIEQFFAPSTDINVSLSPWVMRVRQVIFLATPAIVNSFNSSRAFSWLTPPSNLWQTGCRCAHQS